MLKINECGDVTQVVMGREVAGTVYYWTAAYLIDGLLVDTGCAYTADELSTFLQDKTVDCVVNTHHHEDHVGGNLALLKERGEIISAHHLAVPLINSKLPLREYQELVWGYPEPVHVKEVTGKLETSRYNFEVIDTPGHSPDHIVILEPEQGWCFCGDIFVSENQKVLRADEDLCGMIGSLRKLVGYSTGELTLFTSSGRVFTDGRAVITKFLDHIDTTIEKVQQLTDAGERSAEVIRDRIFGRESGLTALTGGHFSILNLIVQLMRAEFRSR